MKDIKYYWLKFTKYYDVLFAQVNALHAHIYSGESMENAVRACCKGIKIGKILIHRDGDNGKQV